MQRVVLDPKYVGTTQAEQFDFASLLGNGETILTANTTAAVYAGTDPAPSAIIMGVSNWAGSVVSQTVTGGVAGVVYNLVCRVTTSFSQTLELVGRLAVILEAS